MSISSEISRLTQAKADIKTAIENKGVTVPSSAKLDDYPDLIDDIEQGSTPNLQTKSVSITENGTTTVEPDPGYDGLSEVGVSVNVQGGGGGEPAKENDVNFIDYDGTILHSYTAEEFLALTEMPENPTHEGLTSQGWNWALADAKEQVTKMGTCDIGQMYITKSGKTEIDVAFTEPSRLSPKLTLAVNGTVSVDWGDGTAESIVTGTSLTTRKEATHTYSSIGNYTIKISVETGLFAFYCSESYSILRKGTSEKENSVYSNCVKAIRIGTGITEISNCAFYSCFSLSSITVPSEVVNIWNKSFYNCYSLKSITIPSHVNIIGVNAFQNCSSLELVSVPLSVTTISGSAFSSCNMVHISIPNKVSSLGSSAFAFDYKMVKLRIPPKVTSLTGNLLSYMYCLSDVELPPSITSIEGSVFSACYSLASITIPSNVTNIGNYAFNACGSLVSMTIPSNVTNIGNYAFNNCSGVKEYHLLPTTPPTLSNSNAFNNIPSDCIIYVPSESLETYKTATNWKTYASKMVGE